MKPLRLALRPIRMAFIPLFLALRYLRLALRYSLLAPSHLRLTLALATRIFDCFQQTLS